MALGTVEDCDVLIIGAGPCGIFAAQELAEACSVKILDAGLPLHLKHCPLEDGDKCKYCRPICSIMGGFGGAQFFEGTKLSRFPAGSGLINFCSSVEELEALYDRIDSTLEKFGKAPRSFPDEKRIDALRRLFGGAGIDFKYYNAQKVSKNVMMEVGSGMYEALLQKGVEIHFETCAHRIQQTSRGFRVVTNRGIFNGRSLLLATGRLGSRRLVEFADELGIVYHDELHQIELGVRVEAPYHVFDGIDNIHNDIKLKLSVGPSEELRSFCQDYRGFITKCVYNLPGDKCISTLDGHLIGTEQEGGKLSRVVNLAVHHRFPARNGLNEIYAMVGRMNHAGRPVVQDMSSFLKGTGATFNFVEEPSIRDVRNGDIVQLLPPHTYDSIKRFIRLIDKVIPGFAADGNTVLAPSFEMGWKKMSVSPSFETAVSGLYIGGDATGHFRGAMQAAISGLIVARAILGKRKEENVWKHHVDVHVPLGQVVT